MKDYLIQYYRCPERLLRRRGELVERTFAHAYETGALRRLYVRGKQNVQKRLLLQAVAWNLALAR